MWSLKGGGPESRLGRMSRLAEVLLPPSGGPAPPTYIDLLSGRKSLQYLFQSAMAPPTSVTSLAGQSIDNGRLTLIKMIGAGGYGAIYHGIDTRTRTSYAVKVLDKRSNQRWSREAHLHLKVSSHPNVVTLHKILEDSSNLVYLVLDYCPGGDLNTMLMDTRIFAGENELIKSVFLQIVGAVEHCHSKGVYHRDLKPENILCSKDGSRVFLADFGLASQSTSSTSFATGTSQYMSPGLYTFIVLAALT